MTTKRIVSLLGFLAVSSWLVACGGNTTSTSGTPTPVATATSTPTATPTETPDTLDGVVTLLAGGLGGLGNLDGTGNTTRFRRPCGIVTDGANIYVADTHNHTIRQVEIATGVTTTLAGTSDVPGSDDGIGAAASFNYPHDVASDGVDLFVPDYNNHTIRKIVIATGEVTTFAGSVGIQGSDDGIGTAAEFKYPHSLASDGTNLFVADSFNNTIRMIVIATAEVTTLAGTAGSPGSDDGTGPAARFDEPEGITTDGTNLFVADTDNHTIRKIVISTAEVTTLAGSAGSPGSINGTGTSARFNNPEGITTDGTNLFVADTDNHTIRQVVISGGVVTTLAGLAGSSGSDDGIGSIARFDDPSDLFTDGTDIFVADTENHTIRKIAIATAEVTTPAGKAAEAGSVDGAGTSARFFAPSGVATDGTFLFLADQTNSTIRKLDIATGEVSTLAGTAGLVGSTDAIGADARFNYPFGVATDGTYVFVADTLNNTIRMIEIATAEVTTLAGTAGIGGSTDGVGAVARFAGPQGVATDGTYVFVADSSNHTIRKIEIATAEVTTLAGTAPVSGSNDGIGSTARFYSPRDVTTDGTSVFVADQRNSTIRKIDLATAEVTTLAGSAGVHGSADGTGTEARFNNPFSLATDGTHLFINDTGNATIRKIEIATAEVTTLAGTTGSRGFLEGTGTAARFNSPSGIATATGTTLFVSNRNENNIVKID